MFLHTAKTKFCYKVWAALSSLLKIF